nr:uncharacterized protein LOC114925942 [Arachis hypogaea]
MVGCVYKVISKVLVRRMRSVMLGLVGETQSAFVKRRKIHDGALIACETKMGFGRRWREWVMECVSTTSMSVLINGSPTKPFKMERGLRQCDPLSPFLFVLVVDVLHRMIGVAVRNGWIAPLLVGRDNIELSHLQFAYDTVLFCPPEEETIKNYKRLLCSFEVMSGLSINFDKSSLIPDNCEQQWVQSMCSLLGCKEAALPVRYLGIPLGANPRLVKTWKPIIDKVKEKLGLWKSKTINKAGKLVLIKAVLNSLLVYYLSLYKMPKGVQEKLISLQRRFLWSKEDGRKGMALVNWELVQAPKKLSGLGVGNAMLRNTSLLFKWWWRFSKEKGPLWKKWRRELFQWEMELVNQLHDALRQVKLAFDREDRVVWKFDKQGIFSTNSFVQVLQVETLPEEVWCAWLSNFGIKLSVPGTLKEHFESWTGATGRKEERKV